MRSAAVILFLLGSVLATELSAQGSADGLGLFNQTGCAVCHGAEGSGTAAGPRIATEDLSLPEFIAAVRRALRTMPSFSAEVLPDQSLGRIYASLQSRASPRRPEGRADSGARLFAAYGCYSCHANEAQGGMHGPRLGPDPISPERFTWYLRHPSASMPPYSAQVLTDQDIADIYAFVASRPQPPPVASIPLLAP